MLRIGGCLFMVSYCLKFSFIGLCVSIVTTCASMQPDIEDLEKDSMLYQSEILAKEYSGKSSQWQCPYGNPITHQVIETSSVWFTAYGLSTLRSPKKNILQTLASSELWEIFQEIGIEGIHTGPLRQAGGIYDGHTFPSTDGGFDRISYKVDKQFGSMSDYHDLVEMTHKYGAIVIGDLIPGHTGRGPDFQLALKNYKNYPGIYHMVEIPEEDWHILPQVSEKNLSQNLSLSQVEQLKLKGYIVGPLERVIFAKPGVKTTNWSATSRVVGTDGKTRRWVYLHYFKANQPSLNWLDPSFAANQVLAGDTIYSLNYLQMKGIRLDANGLLGVEAVSNFKRAFSESHPLSVVSSDLLAMLIRKLGGFSFQELNLCLQSIQAFSEHGADFSYDFVTRAAYIDALVNQNAELLRLMYRLLLHYDLQPVQFIHALQNHDELNFELTHFQAHDDELFTFNGQQISGAALRQNVLNDNLDKLTGVNAPYNSSIASGPCTTLVGLCAAALGYKQIENLTDAEKKKIQKAHLLLAFFNAMQPGVFAISGWDMVGAYPLDKDSVSSFTEDGDCRWMNRGSYDLMGNSQESTSKAKIPKAKELYGPLPLQMKNPNSFCRQLQKILRVRKLYHLPSAELIDVVDVYHPELLVLLHELPGSSNLQITAINFGQKPLEEILNIDGISGCAAIDMMDRKPNPPHLQKNSYPLEIGPLSGKVILFQPRIVKN